MPATVTRIARTPNLWRVRVDYDGTNPIDVVIPNADLIDLAGPLGMDNGPVRQLWAVRGLAVADARARCVEGAHVAISMFAEVEGGLPAGPVGVPAFGVGVTVDGDGRPALVVSFPIKDFPIAAVVTVEAPACRLDGFPAM